MTMEWSSRRPAALAAGAVVADAVAPAQDAKPIRLVAFAGASNWPIWIGQQKGFFATERLEASLEITPNSRQMAVDIFGGKFDIALTAIDNVVAYVEGQGEAQLPGPADFVAFMGVDDGMLSLMAVPGTTSVDDLKGRELSVDALTTGFAFVLRDALVKSGIGSDEVKVVAVGGGAQRLAALREQKQSATLLNSPLDLIAESTGSVRLAEMRSLIGPYQGICGMARRAWLAENRDTAKAFVRAFHAAVAWLVDPANKDEAIAILRERVQDTPPELAQRIHARLTHPASGIKRDAAIDLDGLRTVLRLRSTYAATGQTLSDPSRYLDSALLGEALARR